MPQNEYEFSKAFIPFSNDQKVITVDEFMNMSLKNQLNLKNALNVITYSEYGDYVITKYLYKI